MAVNDIIKAMEAHLERVNKAILFVGEVTGERFVRNARGTKTYSDVTANLRNSIGYQAASESGKTESFGAGKGGQEGKSKADSLNLESGLIMMAGMEYAAAVESKGFDVISNSVNESKKYYEQQIEKALKV